MAWLLAALLGSPPAAAALPQYCGTPPSPDAAAIDRALRIAAVVRGRLGADGRRAALVSRSGIDLRRFGMRYSHAGVALRDAAAGPWAVRQLYFACDERAPRLFDEGLAAFVLGSAEGRGAVGFVSVLALPDEAARPLEAAAGDDARALSLLGARYSANAHAFSTRYQNCNQWLAELLALAWGADGETTSTNTNTNTDTAPAQVRTAAQHWLQRQGYEPAAFVVGWRPLLWLAALNPFLHQDDHPAEDLAAGRLRVSMPHSVEAFALARHPGAQRLELCHTPTQLVLRLDGAPLAEDCVPEPGDTVISLD